MAGPQRRGGGGRGSLAEPLSNAKARCAAACQGNTKRVLVPRKWQGGKGRRPGCRHRAWQPPRLGPVAECTQRAGRGAFCEKERQRVAGTEGRREVASLGMWGRKGTYGGPTGRKTREQVDCRSRMHAGPPSPLSPENGDVERGRGVGGIRQGRKRSHPTSHLFPPWSLWPPHLAVGQEGWRSSGGVPWAPEDRGLPK